MTATSPSVAPTARLRRRLEQLRESEGGLSIAALGALVVTGTGTGVRFATQLALARWLGVSAYGSFVVARGTGELLAKFPNRGYLLTVVRHLPAYEANHEWGPYRGLARVSVLETGLLALAGSALAILVAAGWFHAGSALIVGLALIPVLALVVVHQALLQAMHRYPSALTISELVQPVVLAGAVGTLLLLGEVGATSAMVAYLVSLLVALALLRRLVARAAPPPSRGSEAVSLRPQWIRTARPMYLSQLAIAALGMTDVLVVGAVLGAAAAGVYAAASRLAALSQLIDSGVESVSASHLAEAYGRGDRATVQRIVDQGIRLSTIPTLTLMLLAVPFGGPVLSLLGSDFAAGRWVLVVLLAGNVVSAGNGPVGFVVSLSGLERRYAAVMVSHAVGGVVLTLVAAFVGGVELVALASTAVLLSWNVWLVVIARRRLGIRCWPTWSVFRPGSAGSAASDAPGSPDADGSAGSAGSAAVGRSAAAGDPATAAVDQPVDPDPSPDGSVAPDGHVEHPDELP